jgi:hypothetical protein
MIHAALILIFWGTLTVQNKGQDQILRNIDLVGINRRRILC